MGQIVEHFCDKCGENFVKWQKKYVLRIEYSSRSHYYREYDSKECMLEDLDDFEEYASRKDKSS